MTELEPIPLLIGRQELHQDRDLASRTLCLALSTQDTHIVDLLSMVVVPFMGELLPLRKRYPTSAKDHFDIPVQLALIHKHIATNGMPPRGEIASFTHKVHWRVQLSEDERRRTKAILQSSQWLWCLA